MKQKRLRRTTRERVQDWFADGKIAAQLDQYVALCHACGSDSEGDARGCNSKEREALFPNPAGFCRYLGIGLNELNALGERYPAEYDRIMTTLEDEALNAQEIPGGSSLLTTTYFKRRLGYEKQEGHEAAKSAVQICFEHDIMEAGG